MKDIISINTFPREIITHDIQGSKYELLSCDIYQRKKRIKYLIGKDSYDRLKIEDMDDNTSKQIAIYLSSILKQPFIPSIGAAVKI